MKKRATTRPAGRRAVADPPDRRKGSHPYSRRPWIEIAAVAVVALGLYVNTLPMGMVWDDHLIVTSSSRVQSVRDLPSLFRSHAFSGATDYAARRERLVEYYRPVWTLSLAIDHLVWRLRPLGYHLTNILLHAAVSCGVLLLARALLADSTAALFSALLFAVHPVHSEAVAWISSRNEILAGLFLVASMIFYVRFRRSPATLSGVLCIVAFVLALLSKETAIMLPALALLYELRPESSRAPRRFIGPLVLGLIAVAYFLLRRTLVRDLPETHPFLWRLSTAPVLVADYLRLFVLPIPLKVFYSISIAKSPASIRVLMSLVVVGLVAAAGLAMRRRAPDFFFGVGWMLATLAPVAGLVAFLRPALMADRYLYIPSVGACLAAGSLLMLAGRHREAAKGARRPGDFPPAAKRPLTLSVVAAGVVLAVLAVLTVLQNRVWQNDRVLMTRMIHDAPDVATGHTNLGVAEEQSGNLDAALREYEIAVRLDPQDRQARRNLGVSYQKLQRNVEAEREFRAALAVKSDDVDAHYSLGGVLVAQGRVDEGIRELEIARDLEPGSVDAHVGLGAAYQARERFDDALREYRRTLVLNPNSATAHTNLGLLDQRLGRLEEANREFDTACRLDPSAESHFNLGSLLMISGRYPEAEREFRLAISLKPAWAAAHNNLGMVLARQKRIPDALPEFQEAVRLSPGDAQFQNNLALARRDVPGRP